jgi:hypothetical protein
MKLSYYILKDETGSPLLIAVLMLLFLSLIGISANRTTDIELHIAGNDKSYKTAFYNADSGIYTTPKFISRAINIKATPDLGKTDNFSFYDPSVYLNPGTDDDGSTGTTFYRQLVGFDAYDDGAVDLQFKFDNTFPVKIDTRRVKALSVAGGGAEFGSASAGAGVSMKGILFEINSFGNGPDNSESNISADYQKILGTAGGR